MVRQWQEFFYDKRYAATPILSPDFVELAGAYGIDGHRVTQRAEVAPAVQAARASRPRRPHRVPGGEGGGRVPDGARRAPTCTR